MIVSGGAIDLTGATFQIEVSSASGPLTDGAELLIGDGLTTITGGPGGTAQTVSSNSILYDFSIIDGTGLATPTADDDLYLLVDLKDVSTLTTTTNQANVAQVLLGDLSASSDTNIVALQGLLGAASSLLEVDTLLDAALPTIDGSIREAGFIAGQQTIS